MVSIVSQSTFSVANVEIKLSNYVKWISKCGELDFFSVLGSYKILMSIRGQNRPVGSNNDYKCG